MPFCNAEKQSNLERNHQFEKHERWEGSHMGNGNCAIPIARRRTLPPKCHARKKNDKMQYQIICMEKSHKLVASVVLTCKAPSIVAGMDGIAQPEPVSF